MTLMQSKKVLMMSKHYKISLMPWLIMSSLSSPKLLKPKGIRFRCSSPCLKNNRFMTSPSLNFSWVFPKVEFNSQEALSFQNKSNWQSGKDLLRKRTLRRERKQVWNMTMRLKRWSLDGAGILKRTYLSQLSCKRNNTIEILSAIKRKRET